MARCVGILFLICILLVVALAQSGNDTAVARTTGEPQTFVGSGTIGL